MEFDSWTNVIKFYNQYLRSPKMKEVWCVLDRDDCMRLVGFMEFLDDDTTTEKEFVATLTFPVVFPQRGLHFVPVKQFKVAEVDALVSAEVLTTES